MAELNGLDLGTHLKAILTEYENHQSIYGYPKKKFYLGDPNLDFSVDFHQKKAATPLGPASGPHTQMVQNIILSFLGGARIMELKTVQILDQLEISRPCIDARNVGYNVEWSQELRLEDSYREYVMAWVLLKILEEMELLGVPKGSPFYNKVFDISVGYDLKGIESAPMNHWIKQMKDASEAIETMLHSLPAEFEQFKRLSIDPHIVDSTTLSTFHGCPPQEIESIAKHLIHEHQLHTIVKKNPTILGYDHVQQTIVEQLGYHNVVLDPHDFESDLQFEEGVAMMKRLEQFAADHGLKTGSKFTNTLVIKNHKDYFQDKTMYLSGPPLHVLAMQAMHKFRSALGEHYHISFSAGITKRNFVDAVSCNMRPVTVCTDLLKTGGYTRMADYLKALKKALEENQATCLEEFILKKAQHADTLEHAGMLNSQNLVPTLLHNPDYHFSSNQKEPPQVERSLEFFDCISCNKCLPVCPNAANFHMPIGKMDVPAIHFQVKAGTLHPMPSHPFVLKQKIQIANLADFCNECGDCDPYCPEKGGPYQIKPRFFFNQTTYETYQTYDGFYFPTPHSIQGRHQGTEYLLSFDSETHHYSWQSEAMCLTLDQNNQLVHSQLNQKLEDQTVVSLDAYYAMKALLHGIIDHPTSYPAVMLRSN